ncbi:MAG: hypothetical protein ABFD92_03555 [Planctomycetaceae bacterium]|nr:hypothetical protein [Planctomycetaceae bacterium]
MLDMAAWKKIQPPDGNWRESLARPQDKPTLRQMRTWTHRGRPLGSDRFIAKLERLVGRRLRPLPVGRPRLEKKQKDREPMKIMGDCPQWPLRTLRQEGILLVQN